MKKYILLYIPVIHQGYIDFLEKYRNESDTLLIIGQKFIEEFMPFHEEIRAIAPKNAASILFSMGFFKTIQVVSEGSYFDFFKGGKFTFILSNDNLSRNFAKKYLQGIDIIFDSTFLRWDEQSVLSVNPVEYDCEITKENFHREIIGKAIEVSKESADWWRHVGGVLIKDSKIISAVCNKHVPSELIPYIYGDPRDFIKAGTLSEIATAFHCEAALIADAAKKGVGLEGSSLYITVFPCPSCAKLIAFSGIKKIFFASGHASLDGEKILKFNKVKIIFVKMK